MTVTTEEGTVRSDNIYCKIMVVLVVVITSLVVFLGGCAVVYQIDLNRIQQVLNETCGVGTVSADKGYISYDPHLNWGGQGAYCEQLPGESLMCQCPPRDTP